jgi:alkylhydroperoxidase family enzyme
MTNINFSDNGDTPFEKLIGHNDKIRSAWNQLEEIFWNSTNLDKNLLEQVRRAMAFENGCEYCMVKAGKPEFDNSQLKIATAIGFAELFSKDHQSISQGHFKMLKEFFTEKEISELCTFISFINASQKLGNIFNLTENYQQNAVLKIKDFF